MICLDVPKNVGQQDILLAIPPCRVIAFRPHDVEMEMARSYVRRTETLSVDRIRQLWDYDAETGVLKWKVAFRGIAVGTPAATTRNGGRAVVFQQRTYQVTRIVWAHFYGVHPSAHVVPKNGDKLDMRIANLKEQSRSETIYGSKKRSTNKSGYVGVSRNSRVGKWVASLTRDYRRVHLGFFDTPEEAATAVEKARTEGLPADTGSHLPYKPKETARKRWISYEVASSSPSLLGFESFEAIIAETGEQPDSRYVITRRDLRHKLGPGNVEWRLPWPKGGERRRYHHAVANIDTSQFEREVAAQDGVCAICHQAERPLPNGRPKALAADHDHATEKQRGALCMVCNSVLGLFEEDADRFRAAADYIENWRVRHAAEVLPFRKDSA
jgi:Recombination endonuclease VII/AP2 domain